jgi:hypothetical protein
MSILRLKRSDVPGKKPSALQPGEPAFNTADGILFVGLSNGGITEFRHDSPVIKTITKDYVIQLDEALYYLVDATSNLITNQFIGTGDGTRTSFNLLNPPVVENSETIYINGTPSSSVTEDIEGEIIQTADGSTTTFHHTTAEKPLKQNSVTVHYTINSTVYAVTDDGAGNISGSELSGTVDYENGVIDLTFTTAPDADTNITMDYSYYPYSYTYTINYETGEIVFSNPPEEGDNIQADYQRAQLDITLQSGKKCVISIKKVDNTNYPVVINASGNTIDNQPFITINMQNVAYKLVCDETNWWIF